MKKAGGRARWLRAFRRGRLAGVPKPWVPSGIRSAFGRGCLVGSSIASPLDRAGARGKSADPKAPPRGRAGRRTAAQVANGPQRKRVLLAAGTSIRSITTFMHTLLGAGQQDAPAGQDKTNCFPNAFSRRSSRHCLRRLVRRPSPYHGCDGQRLYGIALRRGSLSFQIAT